MPDLGPIEDHLHAVATEWELPDFAIATCTLRIEASAPKLRTLLVKAAIGKALSDDEGLLMFRGLHIPGGGRDIESFQTLLRLLRRPFHVWTTCSVMPLPKAWPGSACSMAT